MALICGCGLMVPMLTAGPITIDEHGSYWVISSDLPSTSWERGLGFSAIPPLSGWMQQAFLTVLGKSEWAFRFPSGVCYLGAIAITFAIALRLGGPIVGGIAALILAWHPEAMDEVRIARCYGLLLLMSATLVWITIWWRESPRSLVRGLCWSACGVAALWTHVFAAPLVLLTGASLILAIPWMKPGERPSFGVLVSVAAMVGVGIAPLIPFVERLWLWSPFLDYIRGSASIAQVIGPIWWMGLPVALAIARLTPARAGALQFNSIRGSIRLWLAAWTLIPLVTLTVLSASGRGTLANSRYRVPYAPAGACLIAVILPVRSRPWGAIAGTATALALCWLVADRLPWQPGRLNGPSDNEWYEMANVIQESGKEGEPIFVQSGLAEGGLVPAFADQPLFLEYVACRISRFYVVTRHPRIGLPFSWNPQTGVREKFQKYLKMTNGGRIWVASAIDTDLNQQSLAGINDILRQAGFDQVREWPYRTAVLQLFQISSMNKSAP